MRSGLSEAEFSQHVDKETASDIFSVAKVISEFTLFHQIGTLGIVRTEKDLSYSKALMFSWIKEALNVGKT